MSEKTRHGAQDPSHPHPGARMPKIPDKATLGYAALFALLAAGFLLVLFILPAEYGIDPTGMGRATGLSRLSQTGHELDLGDRLGAIHKPEPAAPRDDTVAIELAGLFDNEYKFHLEANGTFLYAWTSTGPVSFDFHGEPDEPGRPGEFSSYEASEATNRSGSFQAPFTGRHGWYFQNVGVEPVMITLHTWGYYDIVGFVG